MKKASFFLLGLVLLVVAALATAQLWLKPNLEQEFSRQATEYFTHKGFTPKEPIKAHISLITREVEIDPFEIQKNVALGIEEGEFKKSTLHLTWQTVLSLTPFADRLPQSGRITILDSGTLSAMRLTLTVGTLAANNVSFGETDIDAQDYLDILTGVNVPSPDLLMHDVRVENLVVSDGGSSKIEFASLVTTGISKEEVQECSFENVVIAENGKELIRIGKFKQEHIAVYTENEWKALLPGLMSPKESVVADTILRMLMGEKPLVKKTTMSDITVNYEASPLIIGEIVLETEKNAEKLAFSVSRIALPCKLIEEEVGKPLYVPDVVHMNASISADRATKKGYTFAAGLSVDGLFGLESKVLTDESSLVALADNIMTRPLRDFSIRYTDQTLLARIMLYFVPKGSGKQFLLDQLRAIETQSNEDVELLKKLETLVSTPGAIEIATKKNRTFTLAEVATMQEDALPQFFDVTVFAGAKDLDEQMAEILREWQK